MVLPFEELHLTAARLLVPEPAAAAALRLFASQLPEQTPNASKRRSGPDLNRIYEDYLHRGHAISPIVFIYLFRQASIFTITEIRQ